jgi:hypothetical protein
VKHLHVCQPDVFGGLTDDPPRDTLLKDFSVKMVCRPLQLN